MEVYLDNSATTKPYKEVIDAVSEVMESTWGNPSSMHMLGVDAEKYLTQSTEMISQTLRCKPSEILYTSGGTESDNMALIGVAHARKRAGRHIITTSIEHPAILETCAYLEKEGYEISYLGTDGQGRIDVSELAGLIRPDTILVSIMHTNNEIGSVEPLEEAGRIIKEINPACIFHTDAVQGYGKARIIPKKTGIDLMSVSAHKFHGPRGVGFLYIKEGTRIDPIIYGGGQQKGMRSGTENVAGIYGMAVAAKKSYDSLDEDRARMYELKRFFIDGLLKLDEVYINGVGQVGDPLLNTDHEKAGTDGSESSALEMDAPNIISASFAGIRSEVLLHALEDKGIYVSSGSACASNRPHVSGTLTAIGIRKDLLDSTIRFSTSVFTTGEELDYTLENLSRLLPTLRKYTRH
ncbi:MAG: cysteine desulfurase [Lachnospiraceae bacterium]|nr:cysteine desulfurase [Lachnospiraceae bacterium]